MKKFLKWLCIFIVAAVVAVVCIWGGEIRSIGTVRQVGGNEYLYTMEYHAKYDLDDVISRDIDSNGKLLEYVIGRIGKGLPLSIKSDQVVEDTLGSFACTSFQAAKKEGDGYYYGRNYDFYKNPSIVTISRPKKGYATIAVSDMSHFGYGLDKLPGTSLEKLACLASIYAPLDGINEKGLCTSIMALPNQAASQESGKHKVGTTIIMRLWLDRCATVQEALDLAATLDIRHDVTEGSGYHYMIADANGDCAVLEFDKEDGWKSMVVRKGEGENAMLVTNHLLSPKYYATEPDIKVGNTHSRSWWRYETVAAYLAERNGIVSLEEAQEALALVHWKDLVWPDGTMEDTQYSSVYDQTNLTLALRSWKDYETTVNFSL